MNLSLTRALVFLFMMIALNACAGHYAFPLIRLDEVYSENQLGSPAVFLQATDTLEYRIEQGRTVAFLTRYRQAKIYQEAGRALADMRIPYNDNYRVVNLEARLFIPDEAGTQRMIVLKKEDIKDEVLDELGTRVKHFTLPGAREGAVIDYALMYRIEDPRFLKPLVMRESFFIERAEVNIIYPSSLKVETFYISEGLIRDKIALPLFDLGKGLSGVRYTEQRISPYVAEDLQPAKEYVGPTLWPQVKGLWPEQAKTWPELAQKLMDYFRWPPVLNSEVPVDFDRVQTVFNEERLKPNTNKTEYLTTSTRFEGKSRLARGVQLYQAMRSQGLNVKLGLVTRETQGLFLETLPIPALFDASVVVVFHEGKTHFLDPFCQYCPVGVVSKELEDASVLIMDGNASRVTTIPERLSHEHALNVEWTVSLDSSLRLQGKSHVIAAGALAYQLREAYAHAKNELSQMALGLSNQVRVSQISAPEGRELPTETFELDYDLQTQCKEIDASNFECRWSDWFEEALKNVWRETRTTKLILPHASVQEVNIRINLPTGFKPVLNGQMPVVRVNSEGAQYVSQAKLEASTLVLSRRLQIMQRSFLEEEYDAFYKFLTEVRRLDSQPVKISKDGLNATKSLKKTGR